MTTIPPSYPYGYGYPLTSATGSPSAQANGQAFSTEALAAAGWPTTQVASPSSPFRMGYQPAPQALFAQQANAPSPFVLQGNASANPAATIGAQVGIAQTVQQQLAAQGFNFSLEEINALMPQQAVQAIAFEQAQTCADLKAELEAQLPQRRNLLQNVIEIGAPILAGVGTTFLTGGNVFLGMAAAAGTAGFVNERIQKGAFGGNYDPNRKIDQTEKWIAIGTNLIPMGVGSVAGKVVAGQLAKHTLTKGLMQHAAAQATVQFATQGAIRGGITGVGVQTAREVQNGEDFTWGTVGRIAGAGVTSAGTGAVFSAGAGHLAPLVIGKGASKVAVSPSNNYIQAGVRSTASSAKASATAAWQAPGNAVNKVKNKFSSGGTTPAAPAAAPTAPAASPTSQQLELDFTTTIPATPSSTPAAVTPVSTRPTSAVATATQTSTRSLWKPWTWFN